MKVGNKGSFSLGMIVLVWLMLVSAPAWAMFAGGSGTTEDPWQIATPAQLDNARNYLGSGHADKHFVLIADIDLGVAPFNAGAGWVPIGDSVWDNDFRGHFDGRGHSIHNLFIARPGSNYIGLFGITKSAEIRNLALVDVYITGKDYVGSLAGQIEDYSSIPTVISNVSVSGTVTGIDDRIGGLVGKNYVSTIRDSRAAVTVTGRDYVGGLAGELDSGRVEYSSATGDVSGEQNIGGLVGSILSTSPFGNNEASGVTFSAAGPGKTTDEMSRGSTLTGGEPIGTSGNQLSGIFNRRPGGRQLLHRRLA